MIQLPPHKQLCVAALVGLAAVRWLSPLTAATLAVLALYVLLIRVP